MLNPYEVLGVDVNADEQTIKKAYRQLSKTYHPDNNINNPNRAQAEERFKDIQAAYEQIMSGRTGGTGSYSSGNTQYGPGSSRYYSGNSSYSSSGSTSGSAYNGSNRSGYSSGSNNNSYSSSYNSGNNNSYRSGNSSSYNNGNNNSYRSGNNNGSYNSGNNSGYRSGNNSGYNGGSNNNQGYNGGNYNSGNGNNYGYGNGNYGNNGNGGNYNNGANNSNANPYSSGYRQQNGYNNGRGWYGGNKNNNGNYSWNKGAYNGNAYNGNGNQNQEQRDSGWENSSGGSNYWDGANARSYGEENAEQLNNIANMINNGMFNEALFELTGIANRSAIWYYYSAVANLALGNNITAREQAQMAYDMDPSKKEYYDLYTGISQGSLRYRGQNSIYRANNSQNFKKIGRVCLPCMCIGFGLVSGKAFPFLFFCC